MAAEVLRVILGPASPALSPQRGGTYNILHKPSHLNFMCLKTWLLSPAPPSFPPKSHDFVQTWRGEGNEIREGGGSLMEIVRAFFLCQCCPYRSLKKGARKPCLTRTRLKRVNGTFRQPRLLLEIQNTNSIYSRDTSFKQFVEHWEMTRLKYRLHSDEVMTTATIF